MKMKTTLCLLCTLMITVLSGRAHAVTSAQWHNYFDTSDIKASADADSNSTAKTSIVSPVENLSIFAGRQSYTAETVAQEQGENHSVFDAVRIGMHFKFD